MEFGDKIKQLRIKMNLTQDELAARCELSKGFISQVERDLTSPSIATLVNILGSLGTDLKNFFNDTEDKKIVFNKDDVFKRENEDDGNSITWLIPNAQKNGMEPIMITVNPGGRSEERNPHEGEVFGHVLSGSVVLRLGAAKHKVRKSESFYYKADSPYWLENQSKIPAVVLWVSSPPNF